ncbi:MAG: replication-associated recombination protein A [Gemmatimonadetes bacterium]|nr:replication-associated recombination protein A [Gemmatimonadota bacterium]
MTDMFEQQAARRLRQVAPLADRMRPDSLAEFVGQAHLVGPGHVLRRMIEDDAVESMILWGPPGTGKTSLAQVIANETGSEFVWFSAVTSGIKDVKEAVAAAGDRLALHGRRTILFCDEIHRFNKVQQDAFLPHVEKGLLTLIGATTENPSFEVVSALLSRMRVYVLKPLTEEEIGVVVDRALTDAERGLAGSRAFTLVPDARSFLQQVAAGDARTALNTLDVAARLARADGRIGKGHVEEALQQRALLYDKGGEEHFNIISALHKSLRGSDPDAALYWLARMLEAGEDPLYVARRMVRFASEDVGLADPRALSLAVAARDAVHFIGLPEGELALAEAAVYLATAPKSNALYRAYGRARDDARATPAEPVPLHIRNAPTKLMKDLGYGGGYRYDHDEAEAFSGQTHLPARLEGARYYEPTQRGHEAEIGRRLEYWRERRERRTKEAAEAEGNA